MAFSATFLGAAPMALATSSSSVGFGRSPLAVAAWCIAGELAVGSSVSPRRPS